MDPNPTIHYRPIRDDEDAAAAAVVEAAFVKLIAPGYTDEGADEFRRYAHAASIRARRGTPTPHLQIVATGGGDLVGIGEVRDYQHLSMLFVHPDWMQRGIGRGLFDRLLAEVRGNNPGLGRLTVNSSPFAVPVYERLGFEIAGEAREISGIVHVPMVLGLPGA